MAFVPNGPGLKAAEALVLDVDADRDRGRAERVRGLRNEVRVLGGNRVEHNLLGSGRQDVPYVLKRADASAHCERHIGFFAHIAHEVKGDQPTFPSGEDVQEHQFVRAVVVEDPNRVDRIPDVTRLAEALSLHQAAVAQEQHGNDAGPKHQLNVEEVPEEGFSCIVAFLRMELDAVEVLPLNRRGERGSVIRVAEHVPAIAAD